MACDLGTGNNATSGCEKVKACQREELIALKILLLLFPPSLDTELKTNNKQHCLLILGCLILFSNVSYTRSLRYIKILCGILQGGHLIRVFLTGVSCYSKWATKDFPSQSTWVGDRHNSSLVVLKYSPLEKWRTEHYIWEDNSLEIKLQSNKNIGLFLLSILGGEGITFSSSLKNSDVMRQKGGVRMGAWEPGCLDSIPGSATSSQHDLG